MSEETILKSSFFGGYKKQDVIEYMDYVLEENEKRTKKLEEQVDFLTKENKRIMGQISVENKKQPKPSRENKEMERKQEGKNKPITFPSVVTEITENLELVSVRKQMELPEGTYMISKDHGIVTLPEPSPIYQTKQRDIANRSVAITQEDVLSSTTEDEVDSNEEKYEIQESAIMNETVRMVELEQFNDINEEILSVQITELQEELISVKKLLEKEQYEKLLLATKLEYSNELFIKLYNSK